MCGIAAAHMDPLLSLTKVMVVHIQWTHPRGVDDLAAHTDLVVVVGPTKFRSRKLFVKVSDSSRLKTGEVDRGWCG